MKNRLFDLHWGWFDNDYYCERVVKIGHPANKIIKTANDLNVDIIVLGTKGLGNSNDLCGRVTRKILSESNKPVLLLNYFMRLIDIFYLLIN